MAEDRTPRFTSFMEQEPEKNEEETGRRKHPRDHHRRHRDKADRRDQANVERFHGRTENESPVSKLI